VAISAWLSPLPHGKPIPLALSRSALSIRPHGARRFKLAATIPSSAGSGTYRMLLCVGRRKRKPPRHGCVRSKSFSITSGGGPLPVPVPIVIGTNPVTVAPTLDSAAATSATIGSAGGTLTTTAPGGSKLSLSIPANALAGDEQITMTPLQSLAGDGMTMVAGADIEPAGLILLSAATLTVTPATSVPVPQQVAFAYGTGGSQFGLIPLAPTSAIEIPVLQFGGVGYAQATASQLTAQQARPPSDPEAAFLQQLSGPEYGLRQQDLGAALDQADLRPMDTGSFAAEAESILAGDYDQTVAPALAGAGVSFGTFAHAAQVAFGWERMVELLGFHNEFASQEEQIVHQLFDVALPQIWDVAVAKCNGGIETIAGLQAVLSIGRMAELLGQDANIGGPGAINDAIQKCSKIDLQAKLASAVTTWGAPSSLAYGFPISSDQVSSSAGPAPLQLQPSTGSAPANVFTFQSANVAPSETITTYTVGSTYGSFCSVGAPVVDTDLSVTYMSFKAVLTVPADLFSAAITPPSTLDVSTDGADQMTSALECGDVGSDYTVPTQAMRTISYITQGAPVRLTDAEPSGTFSGSFTSPVGSLQGAYSGNGTISVEIGS
jgi:hypothetical protein